MQIPHDKIQEILDRTDLVALIGRHVELKKAGSAFKGLCPFHAEKTPSFTVNPTRRTFKCFGCGVGGDAIAFLRRLTGQGFMDVARELARGVGVELDEREDPAAKERSHLLEANETARRFFEDVLWNQAAGRPGREHLAQRGVTQELAGQFGLGYAPNEWEALSHRMLKDGILEFAAKAGLVNARKSGDGYFDVFRGRLTIPIRSPEGRTVAFGARQIEAPTREGAEPGPKYLNSRETPLYRKGETLYALDLAREQIRKGGSAILVEGYFDVIGLFAAGVRHAVALCSTALTAGHLAALSRVDARELVLLLDGDEAGLKAVERLAAPILVGGVKARVATLPAGDDPDTFALREGRGAVENLLASAPPLSAHLLDRALPRGRASGFEEKMAALARFRPLLEQMPPGMARTVMVSQLAEHMGVAESEVRSNLAQDVHAPRPAQRRPPADAAPAQRALDAGEEMLAALIIRDPALREDPEARWADQIHSLQVRMLLGSERPEDGVETLPVTLREGIVRRLREIDQTLQQPDQRKQALKQASVTVRRSRIREQEAELKLELRDAFARGDEEEVGRIQRELVDLRMLQEGLRERAGVKAAVAARSGT